MTQRRHPCEWRGAGVNASDERDHCEEAELGFRVVTLGVEPKALGTLHECCTTELYPQLSELGFKAFLIAPLELVGTILDHSNTQISTFSVMFCSSGGGTQASRMLGKCSTLCLYPDPAFSETWLAGGVARCSLGFSSSFPRPIQVL